MWENFLLSSVTKEGYDELCSHIEKTLFPDFVDATLLLPYDKGNIYNVLCEKANITKTEYLPEGILVSANMSNHLYNLYKEYEKNN
jgi:GTP-binding protein HflX